MAEPQNLRKRQNQFDLLRIIAAFAVVLLHVSAIVLTQSDPVQNNFNWWCGAIADGLSRWCVPFFVMISGALLLAEQRQESMQQFYKKRADKLFWPILFWVLVYLLWSFFHDHEGRWHMLRNTVEGHPYYHLWFMFLIAGLYLVTPLLRSMMAQITRAQLLIVIAAIFVTQMAQEIFNYVMQQKNIITLLTIWLPYTGYFLAGHWLNITTPRRHRAAMLAGAILCGLLTVVLTRFLDAGLGRTDAISITLSNFGPLVIAMSLLAFAALVHVRWDFTVKQAASLQKTADLTLGVYLIHPIWIALLDTVHINGFWRNPLFGIPFTALAAFLLSLGSTWLLRKLPLLKHTV